MLFSCSLPSLSTGRGASFIFRGYESVSTEQVIDFHVLQLGAEEAMVSAESHFVVKSECSRSVAVHSFHTSLLYWNRKVSGVKPRNRGFEAGRMHC
jgi:hypothetical protein